MASVGRFRTFVNATQRDASTARQGDLCLIGGTLYEYDGAAWSAVSFSSNPVVVVHTALQASDSNATIFDLYAANGTNTPGYQNQSQVFVLPGDLVSCKAQIWTPSYGTSLGSTVIESYQGTSGTSSSSDTVTVSSAGPHEFDLGTCGSATKGTALSFSIDPSTTSFDEWAVTITFELDGGTL